MYLVQRKVWLGWGTECEFSNQGEAEAYIENTLTPDVVKKVYNA